MSEQEPNQADAEVGRALASAAHDMFCDGLRAQGFRFGEESDAGLRTHSQLRPFAELTRQEQERYFERVRDYLSRLAASGYTIGPAPSAGSDSSDPEIEIEKLAELEHERRIQVKLNDGWRYSSKSDRSQKLHRALIPWRTLSLADRFRLPAFQASALGPGELPAPKKEIVRESVRAILTLLSKAGFTTVSEASASAISASSSIDTVGPSPDTAAFGRLVFISARSLDYDHANAVYRFLIANDVAAFFSRESLPALGISDYRKQIDHALERADHMVVVTSSAEHACSPWVEAEWGFFINEKRSGRKSGNLLTLVVGGLKPADLPPSLRYYEIIPFEEFEKVLDYVRPRPDR